MVILLALTATLGQVISDTATVLIVVPIALAAPRETGVSPAPIRMAVAVAVASESSFVTPIATPANMMVMGPAAYRFGDYWKFGLPLLLIWQVVALAVIPLVWPLAP